MICHLTDVNLDTQYFRSIARVSDRKRYPVMIGSIAPTGTLQAAMRELSTPTFALGAIARWQYPLALWRLEQLLQRKRIAVLHAHCFDPTWLGLLAARLARVPFVFTRHHSDHHIRLNKHWHTRVDGWCAQRADHVIAVSQITRQIMEDVEHVPASQITVVHNGMEPLREPTAESIARVRRELNLKDALVCLMIGRLHEEKGHRYLFEAIPEINARCGQVIFLLAGEGLHRTRLEDEVRTRSLQNVVHFLGRRNDVPELIALSSLVVLPSLAESFGFAALEAMSLGKPVVAAATGGIPEVVADGKTGLIVPPAEPASLADAICRVLQNRVEAQAFGEAGRRRAAEFSFDRMIRSYEDVYEWLLRRSSTAQITDVESVREITNAGKVTR